jgi:hypothetical protein
MMRDDGREGEARTGVYRAEGRVYGLPPPHPSARSEFMAPAARAAWSAVPPRMGAGERTILRVVEHGLLRGMRSAFKACRV